MYRNYFIECSQDVSPFEANFIVWDKPFLKLILFVSLIVPVYRFLSYCFGVQFIFRDNGIESSRVELVESSCIGKLV